MTTKDLSLFLAVIFVTSTTTAFANNLRISNRCADIAPRCAELKEDGRCTQWKKFMEEKCMETCGFCSGNGDSTSTEAPATTPPSSDCSDLTPTSRCEELKTQGRCEQWKFMKERCKATCGFCNDNGESSSTQAPTTHVVTNYPTTTPISSDCIDLNPIKRCEELKGQGKCDQWKTFMEKRCKATCDFCDDGEEDTTTKSPEVTTEDNGDSSQSPPVLGDVTECSGDQDGNCECGDTSEGFTTYTFMVDDVQRCFTVFHPLSRAGEKLPVVLSPNCYAKDKLQGISMTSATRGDNAAATKYGYIRIGLSTPDGYWSTGNDNVVNDENPMPCSDEDSKDIPYLKTVFDFIEANPDKFNTEKIYAEGFSQNSMFSAYTGFCFHEKVIGVWQGGSGLALTGERPFVPNQGAQCKYSSFEEYGGQCRTKDPCTECQYWPIYPCYSETRPMVDCVMEYTNDGVSVQQGSSSAEHMYEKLVNEGHDGRLLRFSPSEDGTIEGEHTSPQNKAHWQVGCLGITDPCSETCETSFIACVNSKDVSDASKRASAFEDCIDVSETLSGCTQECAPTYNMLIESETPEEASFSYDVFGAATTDRAARSEDSKCIAEDEA